MGGDAVVVVLGGGAQARVDGGDLLLQQRGEDTAALCAQAAQSLGGGTGGALVVQVLCGGAQQDVAVDGGGDQDALAEGGGDGQQDVADEGAGEPVVDDELAPARGDGEVVVAEGPVEGVGVQPGGVDEATGVQRAARGVEPVDAVRVTGVRDGRVEVQVDSAADRLDGVGQGRRPRADDALAGDVQGAEGAGAEVGFAGVEVGGAEEAGVVALVARGLLGEAGQRRELLLVPGDEQGADAFDGDARLGGVRGEFAGALAHQTGLQRAGDGVESGVQDGGVGLRRALPDVVLRLDEGDPQPRVVREPAGDGASDDPGADDGHVVRLDGQRPRRGDGHAGLPSGRAPHGTGCVPVPGGGGADGRAADRAAPDAAPRDPRPGPCPRPRGRPARDGTASGTRARPARCAAPGAGGQGVPGADTVAPGVRPAPVRPRPSAPGPTGGAA